jgi:hypothetical protein
MRPLAPSRTVSRSPAPVSVLWAKNQAFAHRCSDVIGEFQRRRAGAALLAVDHDEIRANPGFQHGFADRHELPRMSDAELETDRLARGQLAQSRDEVHQLHRRRERLVTRWRYAIDAHRHAAGRRDFARYLGGGKHAAMAGLGALRKLDLDHLDLRIARSRLEALGAERAVLVAAPEVTAAELPDDVATEPGGSSRERNGCWRGSDSCA